MPLELGEVQQANDFAHRLFLATRQNKAFGVSAVFQELKENGVQGFVKKRGALTIR